MNTLLKIPAAVALLAFGTACQDATAPARPAEPNTWTLVSVNGERLPYVYARDTAQTSAYNADTLHLNPDSTFTEVRAIEFCRLVCQVGVILTEYSSGTYRTVGNGLALTYKSGATLDLSLSGTELTTDIDGNIWSYRQ